MTYYPIILNKSTYTDIPVPQIATALGHQSNQVCHAWPGANHVVSALAKQGYYMEIVDDIPEAPGAIAYHDVNDQGVPYAKLGANTVFKNGGKATQGSLSISAALSHELVETIGDPMCNILITMPDGSNTAQELCDPCEDVWYDYHGVALSDFVFPSYFNPFGVGPFDYRSVLSEPFSLTPGGYMIVETAGKWTQKWGESYPEYRKQLHARAAVIMRGNPE